MWLLDTIKEIDCIANESCICSENQLTGVDPTMCVICRAREMVDELTDIVDGFQKELKSKIRIGNKDEENHS